MFDPAVRLTTWSYDARDLVTGQTNWNATYSTVAYDAWGFLSGIWHHKSDDALLERAQYLRDAVGSPELRITSGGFTSWIYDPARQLTEDRHEAGSITTWTYDGAGNRIQQERLAGGVQTVTDYEYDVAGELTTITTAGSTTTVTYDANGNTAVERAADGSLTTYTWDARDRLVPVELPSGVGASVYSHS